MGWGGSIFLSESQSRIYPNMCAKFICSQTVLSKKKGCTDRQTKGYCAVGLLCIELIVYKLVCCVLCFLCIRYVKSQHCLTSACWFVVYWVSGWFVALQWSCFHNYFLIFRKL